MLCILSVAMIARRKLSQEHGNALDSEVRLPSTRVAEHIRAITRLALSEVERVLPKRLRFRRVVKPAGGAATAAEVAPKVPTEERISTAGEAGRIAAKNMRLLSAGLIDVEDLGPAYYRAPDGTIGLHLDEESSARLAAVLGKETPDKG